MPRIRTIKPDLWSDEKLGTVSREARLTFIGLLTFSDDYGVVKGNSIWLKSQIYPYDDISVKDFQAWLQELESLGVIMPFSHKGEKFIVIVKFSKHQKIDRKSKQRCAEELFEGLNVNDSMSIHRALVEDATSIPCSIGIGIGSSKGIGKGSTEGEGDRDKGKEKPPTPPSVSETKPQTPKPNKPQKEMPSSLMYPKLAGISSKLDSADRFKKALRDAEFPKPNDVTYEKIMVNIREIANRTGNVTDLDVEQCILEAIRSH